MKQFKFKLTFLRDILGSQPADENLKSKYIAAKMMTGKTGMSAEIAQEKVKEEIELLKADEKYQDTINSMESKAITVFFRDKLKRICISDVQLRGFVKENFAFIAKQNKYFKKKDGNIFSTDQYYRDWIGDRVMFTEALIPFDIPQEVDLSSTGELIPEKGLEVLQRPIRVQTMQGPRVSLTASEVIRAPNSITFTMSVTDDVEDKWIKEIFERGIFRGLGQWANAQWGSFSYEIL